MGTGPTDSLVMWYTGAHVPICFQGIGSPIKIGGDPEFAQYCAGLYKGYMWTGGARHDFTGGTHNLYNQHVSQIQITGNTSKPTLCNP